MQLTTPQRSITLSLSGTGKDAQATYSYWSPVYGTTHVNAPVCELSCNQATYCLYLLDYAATQNGWTIVKTSPREGSGALCQVPGAFNLSILTYNPYTVDATYRFYIHYLNTMTGVSIAIDPQEGNIPSV